MVETSRLTLAQSSCVTPSGLSMVIRRVRALPPPRISTSTTSTPCAVATRPAISRIVLRSAAIYFVVNRFAGPLSGEADLRAEPLRKRRTTKLCRKIAAERLVAKRPEQRKIKSGPSAHWYVRHELGTSNPPGPPFGPGRNQLQLLNNTPTANKKQRRPPPEATKRQRPWPQKLLIWL